MSKLHRYLCWDNKLIDDSSDIEIRMHHPERKNISLYCDNEWEGPCNGYCCIIKANGEYRMYYRADSSRHIVDDNMQFKGKPVICVALSKDGKTFRKPNLGLFEYNGTKDNNIVYMRETNIDNFSVFYDVNPNCPEDEKFKALSQERVDGIDVLSYFASEDGFRFRFVRHLPIKGTFDSYNVVMYDLDRQKYFMYYRAFHKKDGTDVFTFRNMNIYEVIRDVRVATSENFSDWTEHGRISLEEGQEDYQLYINQICRYYRSPETFIGFPVRYYDRSEERRNFDFMPLADRHRIIYEKFKREGTAVTDCVVMTSHDGFTFDRRDEAFLTPGIEGRDNWWYGDCYMAYGMAETESDNPYEPNEISMYVGENYRIKHVNFVRMTLRLDGFFSWYGKYSKGKVTTKPIEVSSNEMRINFASSALGGVKVTLLDETGAPIEGYSSYVMFGNTVDRPVEFEKDLSELKGQKVKIRFDISDTHLYSFVI